MERKSKKKKIKILLVEDNPDDVKITERALQKGDVKSELYVAWDGVEALDFLYKRGKFANAPRPDLIFLDLNLPKLSGLEVLEKIKEDEKLRRIPVIVLTISDLEEDMIKAYDSGASGYITKPASSSEFIKVITTVRDYWEISELPPE
jgi:CheY-like chemotaxis protein